MWPINRKEKRHSLALNIASAFLLKTVSVLLVFSLMTTYYQVLLQQDNVNSKQQIVALGAANSVKNFIENKIETMNSGSRFGNLTDSDTYKTEIILQKIMGSDESFQQLMLINVNGSDVMKVSRLSSSLGHVLTEVEKYDIISGVKLTYAYVRPAFIDGFTSDLTDSYVSPIFIDGFTSEPHVIVAVPVKDVFGEYEYVLAAEINLKFMWDLIDSIRVGQTGLVFVVDDNGNLIAFSDISRVLSRENVTYLKEVGDFVHGDIETNSDRVKGINGGDVVSTFVPLGVPNWAVIVELPADEAYASTVQQMILTAWIILFSCIITIIIGFYLSKKITKPIVALRDAADKIGRGETKMRIDVDRMDEIGDLARSFNDMSSKLNKSKENLEGIVEKRTRQLDKKMMESERSRIATLNILEDVEETRKKLSKTYVELKKLDRLKAEFMNMAAHELKTPLIPIIGYLDMILKGEMGRINRKEKDSLLIAFRSAQRLQRLVGDILDISKLETGSMKFYFDTVNVESLLRNLMDSMMPFAKEKKIGLKMKIGNVPSIYGDVGRLTEVFENLLSNAIKFTDSGEVAIESRVKGRGVLISVKDTGIGIGKDFLRKKLFQKFQQEDITERRRYGGTGLGLAITKEIVEKHNGKIWAESNLGKGSVFYVYLPISN